MEDEAQMLPDVEASIVEWGNQDISAEEELEAKAEVGQETSNTEDNEEEQIPQANEETQWVTMTTRYGRSSKLPSRFWQELISAALTGMASKNYYVLLYEEEEEDDEEGETELACVGARLRVGFQNTMELHAMNYKAAMKMLDKSKWMKLWNMNMIK